MDFGVAVDECQVLSLFLREFHFIFSNRTVEVRGAPKVLPVKATGVLRVPSTDLFADSHNVFSFQMHLC